MENDMFTCFIRYTIEPDKLEQFKEYAQAWIQLIEDMVAFTTATSFPARIVTTYRAQPLAFLAWAPMGRRTPA